MTGRAAGPNRAAAAAMLGFRRHLGFPHGDRTGVGEGGGRTYEEGTDRLTQSVVTDQTHPYEDQELNYGYDAAGNVTHTFDPTTLGGTGKADNECFAYDGYQRLTEGWTPAAPDCSSAGRTTANLGGASPYWTSYLYSSAGLRTTQTDHTTTATTLTTYCYDPVRPHALTARQKPGGAGGNAAPDMPIYPFADPSTLGSMGIPPPTIWE